MDLVIVPSAGEMRRDEGDSISVISIHQPRFRVEAVEWNTVTRPESAPLCQVPVGNVRVSLATSGSCLK